MRPNGGERSDESGLRLVAPDIFRVVPVFIPASFVEFGTWPGPYSLLRAPGIALTWAARSPDQTIQYVLHEMQQEWERRGIQWRSRAIQNLRELSTEPIATGTLYRDNGDVWLISMMHADGFGPSRLLLSEELERAFPNGYRVALPERSRGFAFSSDLDLEDADTIDNLIRRCHSTGERPLSTGIFEPNDLLSATPSSTT